MFAFGSATASDGPALRSVATQFLRLRPVIVLPMFVAVVLAAIAGGAPRAQVLVIAVMGSLALSFFFYEAWRGRRVLVSSRGLAVSLVITLLGITAVSLMTGGATSPILLMAFAPVTVGFAAFGRARVSNLLWGLAVALFAALALVPPGTPFPAFPDEVRRFLIVIAGAASLLLLRIGVAALSDAHAVARAVAADAAEAVVAGAAARNATVEAMGAKVAHEVKNPLAAIRALVEVMAEKSTDERDQKRLATVLGEVDRISEILHGYLTLARPLDRLRPEPCAIGALVREVAAILEARAARAGVTLVAEGADAVVEVDPRRVKEALLNLGLNAIEATPPGGRVLLASELREDATVLKIVDSGRGMTAGEVAGAGQLFVTSKEGGTGLGVALAKQAIEQHGGRFEVQSRAGLGTTVALWLPTTRAEAGR